MDDATHVCINQLLANEMERNVINGTSTILGVYRHEPAIVTMRLSEVGQALGVFSGAGKEVEKRLTEVAEQIERGEVSAESRRLIGIAFVLEVQPEGRPMHLLTAVFNDRTVHRIGWSRDEASPTGLITVPADHDLKGDPFVAGVTAVLRALTGGELS
ncbi:hypothetical protein [Glycomyces tenuis]|uniref:hypothetical protein n=1 Tax=Glycomyces tenuis TaxID=58116 RepID=UPI00040DCEAC|nr:hypothetical protein [Glycomyces tenuis]